MNKFQKKQADDFAIFVKAQKWVKKNPIGKTQRHLLIKLIETKRLRSLKGELLKAGEPELLDLLCTHFGFTAGNATLVHPAAVRGVVYPKLIPCCKTCGKPVSTVQPTFCSNQCRINGEGFKTRGAKISATRQAETPVQKKKRQDNIEKANLEKYGVTNPMKLPELQAQVSASHQKRTKKQKAEARRKGMETLARNHGLNYVPSNSMDVPSIRRKTTKRVREAYAERNDEIQALRKKRSLVEHGVEHHIHRKEVRDKINKFRKKTVVIGGQKFSCQGYEDVLLQYLYSEGYTLSTDCVGIEYKDALGKKHRYYPDIYAKKGARRLVIEVKSTYTFRWTRDNCPEKFFAGTRWSQKKDADYLIAVLIPAKAKMMLFKNPCNLGDVDKSQGLTRVLAH